MRRVAAALAAALLGAAAAHGEPPAKAESAGWSASAQTPAGAVAPEASAQRSAAAERSAARSEAARESAQRLEAERSAAAGALGLTALRLAAGVALVLGAAGLLARWARARALGRSGSAASIEVVALRSLGPRHRVALIEAGGRRLLVGLANEHICTLLDLSETAEFDTALRGELPASAPESAAPLVSAIGRFEGLDG